MKLIVDFYKELDAFNLILFWGVIIVIILLLIFAIIMINKNKKLEKIIISNGLDLNDDDSDLAIRRDNNRETKKEETKIVTTNNVATKENITANVTAANNYEKEVYPVKEENHYVEKEINTIEEEKPTIVETPVKEENDFFVNNIKEETPKVTIEKTADALPEIPIKEEPANTFVPEEYVKDYSPKVTITEVSTPSEPEKRVPYGRNVLREMSLNQTSPIGITRGPNEENKVLTNARELNGALNSVEPSREPVNRPTIIATDRQNIVPRTETPIDNKPEDSFRTQYEIEQEKEAIISFDELMKRKDEIKIVDEEDAVISIQELVNREKEKLYNITKEEKDEKFIDELKKFRSDL